MAGLLLQVAERWWFGVYPYFEKLLTCFFWELFGEWGMIRLYRKVLGKDGNGWNCFIAVSLYGFGSIPLNLPQMITSLCWDFLLNHFWDFSFWPIDIYAVKVFWLRLILVKPRNTMLRPQSWWLRLLNPIWKTLVLFIDDIWWCSFLIVIICCCDWWYVFSPLLIFSYSCVILMVVIVAVVG